MKFKILVSVIGVLLLAALALVLSFGHPGSINEIYGTYFVDYGFANDTIILKDNGQFVQTIKVIADGRVVTAKGTWQFNISDHDVVFDENYLMVIDGFSKMIPDFDHSTRKSISILPVRREYGRLVIGGDDLPWGREGIDIPYKKQPDAS